MRRQLQWTTTCLDLKDRPLRRYPAYTPATIELRVEGGTDFAPRPKAMDYRVQFVIDLMRADLRHPPSPAEAASRVNLSASRLRHLFNAETGMTQAQYLASLRLERAKELLESTFLNVRQIMAAFGVKDRSHFVRDFKRLYGESPTQYRLRYRNEAIAQRALAKTANR